MSASVALLLLLGTIRRDEFSSCLQAIAQQYLKNRCFSFQFALNFREPSLINVPSAVRSPLLKILHEDWAVYLPAVHRYTEHKPYLLKGPAIYLHCAYIIILNDSEPYIRQIDQILYTFYGHFYDDGGGNRTRIVIGVSSEIDEAKIYVLLEYMFKMGEIDVIFVGKKDGVINVFTLFPFGNEENSCIEDNSRVEILDKWGDGRFENNTDLFPVKTRRKFNNCTILVGTMEDPPHFMLNDEGHGMGGIEYRIVEGISRHLGLKASYKFYYKNVSLFEYRNKSLSGLRSDLRKGQLWMIVSGHSNFIFTFSCITVPYSYLINRITWFFSNPKQVPNWELIILAFDRTSWFLVILTTLAFPSILSVLAKFKRHHPFQNLSTSMLIMLGLLFANPSSVKLKGLVFRIAFAAWLFYIIHVNLAYSAGLTSLLITGKWESKITTFEQMVQLNIKTAMTENIVLQTSEVEEPLLKKVLSNRIIIEDLTKMYVHHELGNITLLEREPTFFYNMKKYDLSFYKSDMNLGFVYLGLKMRRNHFLIDRVAELSSRILEGGLIGKYITEYWPLPMGSRRPEFQSFKLTDLSGPFLILAVGSTISSLVFLWEILGQHFNIKRAKPIYLQ